MTNYDQLFSEFTPIQETIVDLVGRAHEDGLGTYIINSGLDPSIYNLIDKNVLKYINKSEPGYTRVAFTSEFALWYFEGEDPTTEEASAPPETPCPDPAAPEYRLNSIEARLAALESRVAAVIPPPWPGQSPLIRPILPTVSPVWY